MMIEVTSVVGEGLQTPPRVVQSCQHCRGMMTVQRVLISLFGRRGVVARCSVCGGLNTVPDWVSLRVPPVTPIEVSRPIVPLRIPTLRVAVAELSFLSPRQES
jgi:hypothetical protein